MNASDIQLIGDIKDDPAYNNNNQNLAADQFGFGVPEARRELDPTIFDEEVDIKKARRYDGNLVFDEGVEKNFNEYAAGSGDAAGFFDGLEEEGEEDAYSKMPPMKDFGDLNKLVSNAIFGGKADKIVERVNNFMKDLEDIKAALESCNCPTILTNILYFPFYFLVMLLNSIQEGCLWWILAIAFFLVLMAAFGALVSVCFTAYRSFQVYNSRFNEDDGKEKEKGEKEAANGPKAQSQRPGAGEAPRSGGQEGPVIEEVVEQPAAQRARKESQEYQVEGGQRSSDTGSRGSRSSSRDRLNNPYQRSPASDSQSDLERNLRDKLSASNKTQQPTTYKIDGESQEANDLRSGSHKRKGYKLSGEAGADGAAEHY